MSDEQRSGDDPQELANTLRDMVANLDALIEERAAELAAQQLIPIEAKLADLNRKVVARQQELAGLAYLTRFMPADLADYASAHYDAVKRPAGLDSDITQGIDRIGRIAWGRVRAFILHHNGTGHYLACPICHRPLQPLQRFDDTTPLGVLLTYAKTLECDWHHRNPDIVAKASKDA